MKEARAAIIAAVVIVTVACEVDPGRPPIRYLSVAVESGADAPCSASFALACELENVSPHAIERFAARVYLFEDTGDAQPSRPYLVDWHNNRRMPAGESTSFCVDLAEAFHALPRTPPVIEMLHVHEVVFADGSVWRDPLAAWVWRRSSHGDGDDAP